MAVLLQRTTSLVPWGARRSRTPYQRQGPATVPISWLYAPFQRIRYGGLEPLIPRTSGFVPNTPTSIANTLTSANNYVAHESGIIQGCHSIASLPEWVGLEPPI